MTTMAAKKKSTSRKKTPEPERGAPTKAPVDVPVEAPKQPELPDIQIFKMIRNDDESGISGTGVVLQGVLWPDGHVDMQWISDTPSEVRFNSWKEFKHIHIDMHPVNNTEIVWFDLRRRPKKTDTEEADGNNKK